MPGLRRIIHHACWFTLLGPLIGLITIMVIMGTLIGGDFVVKILNWFPLAMTFAWLIGTLPALVTGTLIACLPPRLYDTHCWRILSGAVLGGLVTLVYELIPHSFSAHSIFSYQHMWLACLAGTIAGGIISRFLFLLPGNKKTSS